MKALKIKNTIIELSYMTKRETYVNAYVAKDNGDVVSYSLRADEICILDGQANGYLVLRELIDAVAGNLQHCSPSTEQSYFKDLKYFKRLLETPEGEFMKQNSVKVNVQPYFE